MSSQDGLYGTRRGRYGSALARLARAYEADPDKRRDLTQEVHLALWRSFEGFDARCSLRTWVYRVAHNTAISWVNRQKRTRSHMLVSLEEIGATPVPPDAGLQASLDFHIHELERQRAALRQVWNWYLLPLVPGFAASIAAAAASRPAKPGFIIFFSVALAVLYFAIWRMNASAAAKLDRTIDELRGSGE